MTFAWVSDTVGTGKKMKVNNLLHCSSYKLNLRKITLFNGIFNHNPTVFVIIKTNNDVLMFVCIPSLLFLLSSVLHHTSSSQLLNSFNHSYHDYQYNHSNYFDYLLKKKNNNNKITWLYHPTTTTILHWVQL